MRIVSFGGTFKPCPMGDRVHGVGVGCRERRIGPKTAKPSWQELEAKMERRLGEAGNNSWREFLQCWMVGREAHNSLWEAEAILRGSYCKPMPGWGSTETTHHVFWPASTALHLPLIRSFNQMSVSRKHTGQINRLNDTTQKKSNQNMGPFRNQEYYTCQECVIGFFKT